MGAAGEEEPVADEKRAKISHRWPALQVQRPKRFSKRGK